MEAPGPATRKPDGMTVADRMTGKATGLNGRVNGLRLIEAAAEAALILALVLAPTGWRAMDSALAPIVTVAFAVLAAGGYALHAVTFDYFRLTDRRSRMDVPVDADEPLNRTGAGSRMRG
jgi:predicted exporter